MKQEINEFDEGRNFIENIKIKKHNKLTAVGFTDDQADVLIDMMQNTALGGGMF